MIHRVKKHNDIHEGKWNGLGGKIEAGETPEECAIREIREESGLLVKNLSLKGFLTFPQFANHQDWYAFVYVIDAFEGELIDSPEGVLHWINDSDLTNLNLWEGDREFLPWLDQPGFFSAKFIYEDGKYIDHEVVFYDLE
jgi:8-oxo-dGTP diphosphatase